MDIKSIVAVIITLILVLFITAVIVYSIKTKDFRLLKKLARQAVEEAEEKFGSGTGPIKYTYVSKRLAELLPGWIQPFITQQNVDDAIEAGVKFLKSVLSENKT